MDQSDRDDVQSMAYVTSPRTYFIFILFCTTCRSFETGVIASSMGLNFVFNPIDNFLQLIDSGHHTSFIGQIKNDLQLTYTLEGIVAASPDFGIVPGTSFL